LSGGQWLEVCGRASRVRRGTGGEALVAGLHELEYLVRRGRGFGCGRGEGAEPREGG
jgi:hypothetical protein